MDSMALQHDHLHLKKLKEHGHQFCRGNFQEDTTHAISLCYTMLRLMPFNRNGASLWAVHHCKVGCAYLSTKPLETEQNSISPLRSQYEKPLQGPFRRIRLFNTHTHTYISAASISFCIDVVHCGWRAKSGSQSAASISYCH